MNTNRACGCKSFNSCYLCEAEYGLSGTEPALERIDQLLEQRIFCPICRRLYDPCAVQNRHICGQGEQFHGIELYTNFISIEEEQRILRDLDKGQFFLERECHNFSSLIRPNKIGNLNFFFLKLI